MKNRNIILLTFISIISFLICISCVVSIIIYENKTEFNDGRPTGDGLVDDSSALQEIIDKSDGTIILQKGTYLIKKPLTIDTSIIKKFDGAGSKFIIDGDFSALNVIGNCVVASSNPMAQNADVYSNNANSVIENCNITSKSIYEGTGIKLSNCFKTQVKNCFIYMLSNGIIMNKINRDIIICDNNIYGCYNNGIWMNSSLNLHQCNIYSNIISYCYYCVNFDNPEQIANFQIGCNDIELSSYPERDLTNSLAIRFFSELGKNGMFGEIEIFGNTIQGHYESNNIIKFDSDSRNIINISFVGNHVSNAKEALIEVDSELLNCQFNSNTFKDSDCVVSLDNSVNIFTFNNNCSYNVNGILFASESSRLDGVIISSNSANCNGNYNIKINSEFANCNISNNVFTDNNSSLYFCPKFVFNTFIANNSLCKEDDKYYYNVNENLFFMENH